MTIQEQINELEARRMMYRNELYNHGTGLAPNSFELNLLIRDTTRKIAQLQDKWRCEKCHCRMGTLPDEPQSTMYRRINKEAGEYGGSTGTLFGARRGLNSVKSRW